jgi:hypothetical protein
VNEFISNLINFKSFYNYAKSEIFEVTKKFIDLEIKTIIEDKKLHNAVISNEQLLETVNSKYSWFSPKEYKYYFEYKNILITRLKSFYANQKKIDYYNFCDFSNDENKKLGPNEIESKKDVIDAMLNIEKKSLLIYQSDLYDTINLFHIQFKQENVQIFIIENENILDYNYIFTIKISEKENIIINYSDIKHISYTYSYFINKWIYIFNLTQERVEKTNSLFDINSLFIILYCNPTYLIKLIKISFEDFSFLNKYLKYKKKYLKKKIYSINYSII